MQERLIAAVDLGASKISLSVSNVVDGTANVLFYKERESQGIRHGAIFNPMKACGPLRELIREAESTLDINIHSLLVGLPRWKVSTCSVDQATDRSNPDDFISEDEVMCLKELATENFLANIGENDSIYGTIAQFYSTEDMFQTTESDVVGITGSTLQGHYSIFYGPKKPVTNIQKVMNEIGVDHRNLFLADPTADIVLTSDEKEHGVAMIEIGAGVTSVSVYHRGILRFYDSLPFGGKSITNDIRHECSIEESLAENIKLGYGSCMPERLFSLTDKILSINNKLTGESQKLPVKYLSEIIGSRMGEIAKAALWLIGKSGYSDRLRCGIVLTGGGAELLNCAALFSQLTGLQTRVGYPRLKRISVEGCNEIASMSGLSHIAMINLARDNEYINNAILKENEPEVATAPEVATEPEVTQTPTEESVPEGKLFSDQEEGKDNKKKKEKPSHKRTAGGMSFLGKITTKLVEATGTLFDENIGEA